MNYIILFVDNSRKWITTEQFEAITRVSSTPARGILVDGNYITFGSISRMLTAEEFYTEFPDERPDIKLGAFEELGFRAAGEINLLKIIDTPGKDRIRALEGILSGLQSYIASPEYSGSPAVKAEAHRIEEKLAAARLTVS